MPPPCRAATSRWHGRTVGHQDKADDARLGEGVAETDIPTEIHRREARLARIEAARAALEEEARVARAAQRMDRAKGEWALICSCHNVRKLWTAFATRLKPRQEPVMRRYGAGSIGVPSTRSTK